MRKFIQIHFFYHSIFFTLNQTKKREIKKNFYSPTFSSFYNFLSSYFSTFLTKQNLNFKELLMKSYLKKKQFVCDYFNVYLNRCVIAGRSMLFLLLSNFDVICFGLRKIQSNINISQLLSCYKLLDSSQNIGPRIFQEWEIA